MTPSSISVPYSVQWHLQQFVMQKPNVAPIAEKSLRNIERQRALRPNKKSGITATSLAGRIQHRLYYFAVGHKWKSLPPVVFQRCYDEAQDKYHVNDYLALQKEAFPQAEALNKFVEHLRNLNSHYTHSFQCIKIEKQHDGMRAFLLDSFRMAVTMVYFDQENLWQKLREKVDEENRAKNFTSEQYEERLQREYSRWISCSHHQDQLHSFLFEKFFPRCSSKSQNKQENNKQHKKWSNKKDKTSFKNLLERLLFFEVPSDFDWSLDQGHRLFSVERGTYLSFIGSLFLLSMFLYKDEANFMISKIKGYKRSEGKEMMAKRDIMTFFSKKISAQDFDCEEKNLIYFRDILLYLSKYPLEWNKVLETTEEQTAAISELKTSIAQMEEARIAEVFPKFYRLGAISSFIVGKSPRPTPCPPALLNSTSKKQREHEKAQQQIEAANRVLDTLERRLADQTFFSSYGRNEDRFMEFALRFLWQEGYFGEAALVKCYRFYTTEEQTEFLEEARQTMPKKDFDKLKFHRGRLTHFVSFNAHKVLYPEWDTPFVIQNKAVQVKVCVGEQQVLFSLQRPLLTVLLQHALQSKTVLNSGCCLLSGYYKHYQEQFIKVRKTFDESLQENIEPEFRKEAKRLLPRRALRQLTAPTTFPDEKRSLRQWIVDAEREEERYHTRLERARELSRKNQRPEFLTHFLKKNKGKQFKLHFIKKVWNLMFFKPVYEQRCLPNERGISEHHKDFHLTRDEYKDFCRYMFAFDSVPHYKVLLRELLEKKGFLSDAKFRAFFESEHSLSGFYNRTKEAFSTWLSTFTPAPRPNRYALSSYRNLPHSFEKVPHILYINLNHFLDYEKCKHAAKSGVKKQYSYALPQNQQYLVSTYYLEGVQDDKTLRKLHFKLRNTRVEDCLLYELAIRYLHHGKDSQENARGKVLEFLQRELELPISLNDSATYHLTFPFKHLEKVEAMRQNKHEKEMLREAPSYLQVLFHDSAKNRTAPQDIKEMHLRYQREQKLSLNDFETLKSKLIAQAGVLLPIILDLERYFLLKEGTSLPNSEHHISYSDMTALHNFVKPEIRNRVCHFHFPKVSYPELVTEVEQKFLQQEKGEWKDYLSASLPEDFSAFPPPLRDLLFDFLKAIHNKFFDRKIKDNQKKKRHAQKRYIRETLSGVLASNSSKSSSKH